MGKEILIKEDEKDVRTFMFMFSCIMLGAMSVLNFLLALGIIESIFNNGPVGVTVVLIACFAAVCFLLKGIFDTVRTYYFEITSSLTILEISNKVLAKKLFSLAEKKRPKKTARRKTTSRRIKR